MISVRVIKLFPRKGTFLLLCFEWQGHHYECPLAHQFQFGVELSTAWRDQDFKINLEIPEGETVDVSLNGGGRQFIIPSDHIQFTLSYAEVKMTHRLLEEDIAKIVDYRKRTVPSEELELGGLEEFPILPMFPDS